MKAATPPSGRTDRLRWRLAAMAGAAPVLSGCTAELASSAFGSIALLLAAGGGLGVGWLLGRQQRTRALHESRQQARLARELGGGFGFQTDAACRLRPGPLGPAGTPLWDAVADGAGRTALRAAAERQGPIDGVPVALADAPQTLLEAHAAPLIDEAGAFGGYLGVLRPLGDSGPAAEALAALVDAFTQPVLVALRRPGDARWQRMHASPAARTLLGEAPQIDDDRLKAALPEALRAAWDAAHAEAEGHGWHWRRATGPAQELCVLWQDAGAPDATDEQAAFSYTVSHDLRAPIRVVEGFTRILKEDYGTGLDRVANDHLDRVLGAAARMNQMIDAMLTLARLSTQPLARQPVNLSQLASYVVDDLRRQAPDRRAEVEIEPGLQVQGDPTLLRLVLENLLGNAWKYTSQRPQARIVFGRETLEGRRVFVVRDNGAGFDMRAADRLFGLFQRLHSAADFPGTGVGLASVRRIVQRHGGDIWADAEPGRGAAFHFTLRD